jgi:hypothetical protein
MKDPKCLVYSNTSFCVKDNCDDCPNRGPQVGDVICFAPTEIDDRPCMYNKAIVKRGCAACAHHHVVTGGE